MAFYKLHMFFCTNFRTNGKKCCEQAGATQLRLYAKNKLKQLGLAKPGGVRVNIAGCMGRCAQGPTIVIYPDAVWYTYQTENDIDEIIEKHIIGGKIVKRLLMPELQNLANDK
ncbi:MAG: NAD(P)H-dependent oxidoreductase subunit E [Pseudomonadota bacterium]